MAKRYSAAAGRKVARAMHERKTGTLRSGGSGRKVTSKAQAIAIGLSEARREGAKVPAPGRKRKSATGKSAAAKKSRRPAAKKTTRAKRTRRSS